MSGRSRRFPTGIFLAGLLTVGLLTGCSSKPAADLQVATAQKLQTRVLEVAQLAANKDYAGALRSLEQLNRDLGSAAANGEVSFARDQSIQNAINLVREDLTAAMPTPTPTPQPTQTVLIPVPTTIVVPVPVPAPAPSPSPASPTATATPTPSPTPSSSATNTSGNASGTGDDDGNGGPGHSKNK
jgi:outer membrane biosynthesis protein TonB